MNIRPEEISNVIKEQIRNYTSKIEMKETGTVILVGDGIARVYGLRECMASELLEFEDGSFGMAQNLEAETVSVALLSNVNQIREGSSVRRTGKVLSVPVGEAMLGRVVNALGEPIDGKGPIATEHTRPIESEAPGIIERKSVSVPLQTGIKAIDSMIPIGRGQRELIIGDRQTGKTEIAIDTIINQRNSMTYQIQFSNILYPYLFYCFHQSILRLIETNNLSICKSHLQFFSCRFTIIDFINFFFSRFFIFF